MVRCCLTAQQSSHIIADCSLNRLLNCAAQHWMADVWHTCVHKSIIIIVFLRHRQCSVAKSCLVILYGSLLTSSSLKLFIGHQQLLLSIGVFFLFRCAHIATAARLRTPEWRDSVLKSIVNIWIGCLFCSASFSLAVIRFFFLLFFRWVGDRTGGISVCWHRTRAHTIHKWYGEDGTKPTHVHSIFSFTFPTFSSAFFLGAQLAIETCLLRKHNEHSGNYAYFVG